VQLDIDRLLALVRRELGADDARLVEAGAEATDDERELRCLLNDGRSIVARFVSPPPDRGAKQRRLEMLVSTFRVVVGATPRGRSERPPPSRSLADELSALCERCEAANAFVVDAKSPVVWGAARSDGIVAPVPDASSTHMAEEGPKDQGENEPRFAALSRRALKDVRALPDLAALRKGKHVRLVQRGGDAPLLGHSFAGIYLLLVVFEAAFDELRAERAILEALPRIERLVLALPPLDPTPQDGAGVVAMRRPRRR